MRKISDIEADRLRAIALTEWLTQQRSLNPSTGATNEAMVAEWERLKTAITPETVAAQGRGLRDELIDAFTGRG